MRRARYWLAAIALTAGAGTFACPSPAEAYQRAPSHTVGVRTLPGGLTVTFTPASVDASNKVVLAGAGTSNPSGTNYDPTFVPATMDAPVFQSFRADTGTTGRRHLRAA
jgi:hypothetical protein